MTELLYMIFAIVVFMTGYKVGQQSYQVKRKHEAKQKNTVRNMYNDIKDFIKEDEEEKPVKGKKRPEDEEDETNKFFL